MSGLLLSGTEEAKNPYKVRELGLALYSREELAYYIFNYVFLLDNDFINEELLSFVGEELHMKKLEDKIRKWAADRFDLFQVLYMMLQDIHYHDEEELAVFKERLEWLRKAAPSQRKKKCADFLLSRRRYAAAITMYESILAGREDAGLTNELKGRIYHNRAIASVGLFEYDKALIGFARAYELLGDMEILKELYFTGVLAGKGEIPDVLLKETTSEKLMSWKDEFEGAWQEAAEEGSGALVEDLKDKDSRRRKAGMNELLSRWKISYREMVKV